MPTGPRSRLWRLVGYSNRAVVSSSIHGRIVLLSSFRTKSKFFASDAPLAFSCSSFHPAMIKIPLYPIVPYRRKIPGLCTAQVIQRNVQAYNYLLASFGWYQKSGFSRHFLPFMSKDPWMVLAAFSIDNLRASVCTFFAERLSSFPAVGKKCYFRQFAHWFTFFEGYLVCSTSTMDIVLKIWIHAVLTFSFLLQIRWVLAYYYQKGIRGCIETLS